MASRSRAARSTHAQPPAAWVARARFAHMGALIDRVVDGAMLLGMFGCVALLVVTLKMLLFHILCGLLFMSVAAYTLVRGGEARSKRAKLGWFVSTGAIFFLFAFWAFKVVFPPPNMKESVGCGGVRFVDVDGKLIDIQDPSLEDGRGGALRTEL